MGLFRGRKPQKIVNDELPSWVVEAHKVNAGQLVSFLRTVPVQGVEYLLVLDGRVQGRFNQSISLSTIQVLTGNYVVYCIDVRQRTLPHFTLKDIRSADPSINVDVESDVTCRVESAEELFTANIGEIELEVKRRIERKVRQICIEYMPGDIVEMQKRVQHTVENMEFDFGMRITDALMTVSLPKALQSAMMQDTQRDVKTIEKFTSADITFEMPIEFYGQTHPYNVMVSIGVELDERDPEARAKLVRRAITSPQEQVRKRAEPLIRQVLRNHKTSDLNDAEETAVQELKNMRLDFGVVVAYADVQIRTSATERADMQAQRFEVELRDLLRQGWPAVFARMAARPEFKERLEAFVSSVRLTQVADEDRVFEKLNRAIKVGVIDPELMDKNTQHALTSYLLAGTNANADERDKLPGGQPVHRIATESEVVDAEKGSAQHDVSQMVTKKPDPPAEWGVNADGDD